MAMTILAYCAVESGGQRRRLAKVAAQSNVNHPWVERADAAQDVMCFVGAAVVNKGSIT